MAVGAEKHLYQVSVKSWETMVKLWVLPCWVGVSETTTRYLVDFHWSLGKWFIFQESIQVVLAYIFFQTMEILGTSISTNCFLGCWTHVTSENNHGCLGFIRYYIHANQLYMVIIILYMVFIISHCKNPSKPISTMIARCFLFPMLNVTSHWKWCFHRPEGSLSLKKERNNDFSREFGSFQMTTFWKKRTIGIFRKKNIWQKKEETVFFWWFRLSQVGEMIQFDEGFSKWVAQSPTSDP